MNELFEKSIQTLELPRVLEMLARVAPSPTRGGSEPSPCVL